MATTAKVQHVRKHGKPTKTASKSQNDPVALAANASDAEAVAGDNEQTAGDAAPAQGSVAGSLPLILGGLALLGGGAAAAGGGGGSSPTSTATPSTPSAPSTPSTPATPTTPAAPTSYFSKIASVSIASGGTDVSSSNLKLYYEGIAFQDVNGDGHKDIIITNLGNPGGPILATDPPISIFLNDKSNKFVAADTSKLPPAGWINDYVFLDSNKNGISEIIAIDHGREVTGQPLGNSQLRVYEWDGAKFIDLTSKPSGNESAYNHNSSSVGDLNGDGLLDFSVATISGNSKIYFGDAASIFKLGAQYTFSEFGSTGATAVLAKEGIAVFLPYNTWDASADFNNAEFVKNGVVTRQDARTGVLPANFGYSVIQVADINGDGRTDFIALGENPNTSADGKRVFVTFMQKADGTFDIFNSFLAEAQITDSKLAPGWVSTIWSEHKFSLVDMNGDKKLDLFWGVTIGSTPSDLKYNIFFGDGAGHFSRNEAVASNLFKDVSWNGTARTEANDINGDGLGDLIVFEDYLGKVTPMVFINNGVFA